MTTTNTISMSALRRALRETYGDRMYSIRADGSVVAYMTPMPNTNQDGWAHIGWASELLADPISREYAGLDI